MLDFREGVLDDFFYGNAQRVLFGGEAEDRRA